MQAVKLADSIVTQYELEVVADTFSENANGARRYKNFKDFMNLVQDLVKSGYHYGWDELEADENGWVWMSVGHNSSHTFYIGHDADWDTFAVKAMGEGMDGEQVTRINRQSGSLAETMDGAYLGHY